MAKKRKEGNTLPEGVIERDGKLYARITYRDERNRRKQRWRFAESVKEAKRLRRQLLNELEDHGSRTVEASQRTFEHLATYFKENYLIKAEYQNGRKTRGRRSLRSVLSELDVLRDFFGRRKLRAVTYAELERLRAQRFKTPTPRDVARHEEELKQNPEAKLRSTRAVATVNRELALLRRMFNVAVREGWLIKNPFHAGEPLISVADERKRERILTRDEEARLLAACGERPMIYKCRRGNKVVEITARDRGGRYGREHLRPLVIMALDTGCRQGEMLKLRWRDVDFDEGIITLQAFNTKTMRERQVAMTARLRVELERLWQTSSQRPGALVFGIANNVNRSFRTARKAAGLDDVRFHDLRHTATRLIQQHIPLEEVGRVLGHTQRETTYRYVNANVETIRRASAAIDAFHGVPQPQVLTTETVN